MDINRDLAPADSIRLMLGTVNCPGRCQCSRELARRRWACSIAPHRVSRKITLPTYWSQFGERTGSIEFVLAHAVAR